VSRKKALRPTGGSFGLDGLAHLVATIRPIDTSPVYEAFDMGGGSIINTPTKTKIAKGGAKKKAARKKKKTAAKKRKRKL